MPALRLFHNALVCSTVRRVMREQTIVAWGDVPFVHFVTAVYLDIVNDDASQTRAQAQASTADRETANDCGETPECWAWTGAKDGGIVRWSLNESAARRVGNVGAVNHCSGHDAAIVLLVRVWKAVVSIDEAGVMCTWDHFTGLCLHKRAIGQKKIKLFRKISVKVGEDDRLVLALICEPHNHRCCVVDPFSTDSIDLAIPHEIDEIEDLYVDSDGILSVRDKNGRTQGWAKLEGWSAPRGASLDLTSSAFDLTGWSDSGESIIQLWNESNISPLQDQESFDYSYSTPIGCIQVKGNETSCVISLPTDVFSLADRWNSKESITITSCAPSNGEHYAPESRIYGYSDGTIRLYPLLGNSDKLSVLSGHDGAVLSLLQWVRHDNERFLISGGKDGTIRAWSYLHNPVNVAVLRHHQGPIRSILPVPTNIRDASWKHMFITIGDDGVVGLVSGNTWTVNFTMSGTGSMVKEMIWNAPRGILAVLSKDESLHIWDILTGVLERHLTGRSASMMMDSLRDGSFHVSLYGSVDLPCGQWKYKRKRSRALEWRSAQNIFSLSVNMDSLLEPASHGLPTRGNKRQIVDVQTQSELAPMHKSFGDEELRALHLLLGVYTATFDKLRDQIYDQFSTYSLRGINIGLPGSHGAATFPLPSVRSCGSSFACENSLISVAIIMRIIQLCEESDVSQCYALLQTIEDVIELSEEEDLLFYAKYFVHEIDCVRRASKRSLSACLKKSVPSCFHSPAPEDILNCRQFAEWSGSSLTADFSHEFLGLIISSTMCLTTGATVHDTWHSQVACALLKNLQSSSKTVAFTSASFLTAGIKQLNWSSRLPDSDKTLNDVFRLCSSALLTSTSPTESMMKRETLSDLLAAFIGTSPCSFFKHMNNSLCTLKADDPAHMLALMALIRVAQTNIQILKVNCTHLMETLMIMLSPSNAALRQHCQQGVYALMVELGKSSSMAFHRETHRFALANDESGKNGTVLVIYDLQSATKWRMLEGNRTNQGDSSAAVDEWSNSLNLLSHTKQHSDRAPGSDNTMTESFEHKRGMSELSVKAVSFDSEGNQVAAYLDRLCFVYIWDLTPSWRQTFSRGALSLRTSYEMPCIPSEQPLNDTKSSNTSDVNCSLIFVKPRQLHLVHGNVEMVFSFG